MSDFVVRGIDRQKYMRFRAVLTDRDETLGEWLDRKMDVEIYAEMMTAAQTGAMRNALGMVGDDEKETE